MFKKYEIEDLRQAVTAVKGGLFYRQAVVTRDVTHVSMSRSTLLDMFFIVFYYAQPCTQPGEGLYTAL